MSAQLVLIAILTATTTTTTAQQFQCHVPGQCTGITVGLSPSSRYNECLDNCRSNPNCNWFTHFEDIDQCSELYDCPIIDTTCENCHSGQVECGHLAPVCNAQGVCNGHLVSLEVAESAEECLGLCQSVEECRWYSYFSDTEVCQLTEDCVFFDGSCGTCLAGERGCPIAIPESHILFVIGGDPMEAYGSVEFIDLSDQSLTCPTAANAPLSLGSVATFIDDKIMVCGGSDSDNSYFPSECYNHDVNTDSWTETTYSMSTGRFSPAAVQLSPTRWWITGGNFGGLALSSTEVFTVGEGFSAYVEMPEDRFGHNLVKVNDTHVVLLGGNNAPRSVWMFNVLTESWNPLPALPESITTAHAGLVTNPDGSKEVVVGPDFLSNGTQILNLDTLTWRYGPDFPDGRLSSGASVPYGDTFLVVGGSSSQDSSGAGRDAIYKYEVEGDGHSWSRLPQNLMTRRYNLAALMVPDDYIVCVGRG